MKETFRRRFKELETAMQAIEFRILDDDLPEMGTYVPSGQWQGWGTSAQNLIRAVYGVGSPHYENYVKAYSACSGHSHSVMVLFSVFTSAKEDFDGGYVFDVELQVSGEVFADFVALARHSLSEGNKDVAAVLACAALEDALKRYAAIHNLPVDGKAMAEVVNALKSAGLVAGAQKTLLDAMPRIRNLALHGDWAKLSEPDVASVLGFVESFLLTKFTP